MSKDSELEISRDARRDLPEGTITNPVRNTLRARKHQDCTVEVEAGGLLIRREDGKKMKLVISLWDLLHYLLGKTRADFWRTINGVDGVALLAKLRESLDESAFTGDR
jgi:hypothetical protein